PGRASTWHACASARASPKRLARSRARRCGSEWPMKASDRPTNHGSSSASRLRTTVTESTPATRGAGGAARLPCGHGEAAHHRRGGEGPRARHAAAGHPPQPRPAARGSLRHPRLRAAAPLPRPLRRVGRGGPRGGEPRLPRRVRGARQARRGRDAAQRRQPRPARRGRPRRRRALSDLLAFGPRGRFLAPSAGSGAVGAEAASRGFQAVCVELAKPAAAVIRRTAASLGLPVEVVRGDALAYAAAHPGEFDVVFAAPPYPLDLERAFLGVVGSGAARPGGLYVLQHPSGFTPTLPEGFQNAAARLPRYGSNALTVVRVPGG